MKIYNGNNLVGEVKELTKENFNKYFSTNFTEYQNNCGYNIGDYVVYGGKLYKCIKTIAVSEEFNPSKWEKVYGFNSISSLKIENDKLYITFENGESKEIKNFSLTNALNQQVEYGQFGFNNTIEGLSTIDTLVPFKTKIGNIELNSDGTITLKANKTYKLSCYFRISDTDALKSLSIKQNETFLFNVVAKASETTETCTSVYIFTPTENCKVGLYTSSFSSQIPTLTSSAFYSNTKLIVQEIAQPVVNNINYTLDDINNQTNIEDTPIGHIISFMGTKAPDHYLICDGSEYNIADYQKLADFINDQFGSYNYFGGDGTTTFAVPDLRNEFIRGYHGTSSEQLSGEIGKHQDATTIPKFMVNSTGNNFYVQSSPTDRDFLFPTNIDKNIIEENATKLQYINTSLTTTDTNNTAYTTRPTNVAVLFCIKYENTYYVNVTNNNTYKETVLYDGFASSGTIPLSDNVKNYDYIDIYGCTSGSPKKSLGGYAQKTRVRVDEIDTFRSYCLGGREVAYVINCFLTTSWNYYIKIQCFDTDTSLLINQTNSLGWGTCGVYKVVGIKY